jgi:molecular chaperone Hsp33
MQEIQGTYPLPTVAVGRAMIGSLLMASQLKEGQSVGVLIKGNGPLAAVYADASFIGQVRGYTPVPLFDPGRYDSGLKLSESIGKGLLTVVRHQPFQRVPHQGTVELVSGEIGDDIASYLHMSHQIRSIVSLGVYLDTYGKVKAAGGVLIEVMPGVEDSVITQLEKNASAHSGALSKMILEGKSAQELIEPYFKSFKFLELPHDYPVEYHCPCTKERVVGAMAILGVKDLDEMIAEEKPAEVVCQMCGKPYSVSTSELKEVRDELHRNSLH